MPVTFSSVSQSCLTLSNPIDCSMPGFPVHHQLLKLAQTHVYWVSDAIQPSHPLLSPSHSFDLSQHQGLFHWVSSSHQVAELLGFELQDSTWISLSFYCSFQHLQIPWRVLCRWGSAGPYSYYDTLIARCLVHLTSISVPDMSSICWVFLDAIADLYTVNFHRTMAKILHHILIIMNNVGLNNCIWKRIQKTLGKEKSTLYTWLLLSRLLSPWNQ